jgi:alpha-ribazole phosphatase
MTLHVWRHPPARGAAGRCIGRTDLAIDPRRAKRLAHRIRTAARRQGLPRIVLTSPLLRSREVGRWLHRWGWLHRVDPALAEMDFGRWDGRPWAEVPAAEVELWCADFLHYAPGAGECLHAFFTRVQNWSAPATGACIVGHAGWMLARRWLGTGEAWPTKACGWPPPPPHGTLWILS